MLLSYFPQNESQEQEKHHTGLGIYQNKGYYCLTSWSVSLTEKLHILNASGISSVQFSHSVVSDLCDPMNHSTPGLPVHHQLPESTQTHVHRVGDAIQPSHPLPSPSPPAPNPSQHQGLFQWVNSLHEVAKVLEFQLQHQSFQWTPRTDLLLGWTGWIFLQSKGLSVRC